MENICPACKRYVGLLKKDVGIIACEWHTPQKIEISRRINGFNGSLSFKINSGYTCDYMKKLNR